MAMAKQVHYNPPLALLPKRKQQIDQRRPPTLTVTIPFTFSKRLSHLHTARTSSAVSIQRRAKTTSLPRLVQPTAKPSEATTKSTTKSTTTHSGSGPKRTGTGTGSGCGGSILSAMGAEEQRTLAEAGGCERVGEGEGEGEEEKVLSPEEEEERRQVNDKCLQWLDGLPSKFSGMHIVQHAVHTGC